MRESRTKVAMKYNIIPDLCYPVLNIPSYLHLMYPYNHGHWFLFHRSSDAPSHSIGSSGMIFLCWHQSLHRSRLCIHSISVLQTPNISRICNGKGILHIVVQLGRVSVNPQDLCLKQRDFNFAGCHAGPSQLYMTNFKSKPAAVRFVVDPNATKNEEAKTVKNNFILNKFLFIFWVNVVETGVHPPSEF